MSLFGLKKKAFGGYSISFKDCDDTPVERLMMETDAP